MEGDKMNYTEFYKEVRKYATNYASRLFRNGREEAVDKAMDKVEDWVILHPEAELLLPYSKKIAKNSLVNTFRDSKVESVYAPEWEGRSIYQLVNKNKNLKVRLDQIKGREREIMTLYSKGMRQVDIVKELKLSKQYISQVVKRWTI